MIDNKLHDEIKWEGKALIVDTCFLGYGENPYETMALRHGGKEVECVRSATLEQAQEAHAAMLGKYTAAPDEQDAPEAPPPLSGKYAKLRDDLRAALDAALDAVEVVDDGGTCNMDAAALMLPRWNSDMVKQAAREAGTGCFVWDLWGRKRYVFCTPSVGQARRNEVAAETMTNYLAGCGYDVLCYQQMD